MRANIIFLPIVVSLLSASLGCRADSPKKGSEFEGIFDTAAPRQIQGNKNIYRDTSSGVPLEKKLQPPPSTDLHDCIIRGLKGVASDVAARMVKQACEAKETDTNRKREEHLQEQYGTEIKNEDVAIDEWHIGPVQTRIRLKNVNTSSNLMVTYVRITFTPAKEVEVICAGKSQIYAYKVALLQGKSVEAQFPTGDPTTRRACINVDYARGKEPTWIDSAKAVVGRNLIPLDKDVFLGK